MIQEARLADGSRYGGRGLRPDRSLPTMTAEELSVHLSGMRDEEIFAESDPASVARRCGGGATSADPEAVLERAVAGCHCAGKNR